MGDFEDGQKGLMRPGGGDWNAFSAGSAYTNHQNAITEMTARHHAATEANFAAMWSSQASTPIVIGPMSPRGAKIALILLALPIIFMGAIWVLDALDDQTRASWQARRSAQLAEAQQGSDRAWKPVLRRALLSFDPEHDLAAVAAAPTLSACHRNVVTSLMAGGVNMLNCQGTIHQAKEGPVEASVHYDRFTLAYVSSSPTIRHRAIVMALTKATMHSGPDLGADSPVQTAIARFGREAVGARAGKGCIVIETDRIASNRPADDRSLRSTNPDFVSSYAGLSTVSIACPDAKKSLRMTNSKSFDLR